MKARPTRTAMGMYEFVGLAGTGIGGGALSATILLFFLFIASVHRTREYTTPPHCTHRQTGYSSKRSEHDRTRYICRSSKFIPAGSRIHAGCSSKCSSETWDPRPARRWSTKVRTAFAKNGGQ